jgi:hypothetical protein
MAKNGCAANTVYVGNCLRIDATGKILSSHRGRVHSLEDLLRIRTVWRGRGQIVQPEVLFPRDLVLAVGGLNRDNHYTMDYELWGKLFLAGARFHYTAIPFGMFRKHADQKTRDAKRTTQSLTEIALSLLDAAECFSEKEKTAISADLQAHLRDWPEIAWRRSGRLARLGLPRSVVTQLRNLKIKLREIVG